MKALILAAGKSTRIAPVSSGQPKPLLKVGSTSVLEHNLNWLKTYGIKDIWINLHYKPKKIKRLIGDGSKLDLNIKYSFEREILGTAGAVKKLEAQWKKSFLVVYGDNFFDFDLAGLISTHNDAQKIITIALFNIKHNLNSGIAGGQVKTENGNIIDFVEGESNYDLVNAGCYVCEPSICNYIPKDNFYDFAKDLSPKLLKEKIVLKSHIIKGFCLGIDNASSYTKTKQLIRER